MPQAAKTIRRNNIGRNGGIQKMRTCKAPSWRRYGSCHRARSSHRATRGHGKPHPPFNTGGLLLLGSGPMIQLGVSRLVLFLYVVPLGTFTPKSLASSSRYRL